MSNVSVVAVETEIGVACSNSVQVISVKTCRWEINFGLNNLLIFVKINHGLRERKLHGVKGKINLILRRGFGY